MALPVSGQTLAAVDHLNLHLEHTNVKASFGAVGDGVANDATAIQAAINAAVAAGGGTIFLPKGIYRINSNLTHLAATPPVHIVGAGRDVTIIRAGAASLNMLWFDAAQSSVRDLTIDGLKATHASNFGIVLGSNATDFTVSDCRIRDTASNAIECEADRTLITNCLIDGSNASAVRFVANADDCAALHNVIRNCHNGIFYYDNGTSSYCRRGRVIGNLIESMTGTTGGVQAGSGITGNGSPELTIIGNTIKGNTGQGLHVFGASPGTKIIGNTILACGQTNQVSGLDIGDVGDTDFLVQGNFVSESGAAGIFNAGCARAIIIGNTLKNNGKNSTTVDNRCGIVMNLTGAAQTKDCIVVGNACYDDQGTPTQTYGIREWQGVAADYANNVYADNRLFGNITAQMSLVSTTAFAHDNKGFNPQGTATITVTASPFTYTNNDNVPEAVYIRSGTVSAVAKDTRTIFVASPCTVFLEPGEAVTVTYSVAPTMEKDRK